MVMPPWLVANGGVVRAAQAIEEKDAPRFARLLGAATPSAISSLRNQGNRSFIDVAASNPDFCATPNVGRALAYGCIFNDGAISLLLTTAGGPAKLLRNVAPNRGHWLIVRAMRAGLWKSRRLWRAKVIVRADGKEHVAYVNPSGSYLASNDPRLPFRPGLHALPSAIFTSNGPTVPSNTLRAARLDRICHLALRKRNPNQAAQPGE